MMYVLDTNVLSELRKVRLGKADGNVAAWTESVDAADLFISTITMTAPESFQPRAARAARSASTRSVTSRAMATEPIASPARSLTSAKVIST